MTDWSAVLFDLDGTIMDSSPIICRAMSVACAEFGHERAPEVFAPYIGPPPWHTFAEVTGEPDEVVERIVPRYREIYDGLMDKTPVYPGMPSLIEAAATSGLSLAVATSKLRSAAIALLEGVGLADRFVTIQGAGTDPASAVKATVIGKAVADLESAGVDTSRMVLVGDRHHDIDGAAGFGIPTILVTWGYAQPGEEEGALAVADHPGELAALLGVGG
ncbi:MAG: HAD hydrolase-like protein [Propionibacteriaceae bacterium]|nr:HAD hydrolase-like protein [Propionibacteriaceae bacterium]